MLTRAVQIAVRNDDAQPRPGQLALTHDIWRALTQRAGMAGIAPTGTGKSLAHMSCAAMIAYLEGERTVISTDSLALQAQFMEKDLPVVAAAMEELHDFELRFAVLKGANNYVDPVSALTLAQELTGIQSKDFSQLIKVMKKGDLLPYSGGGRKVSNEKKLAALAIWALEQYLDDRTPGDRDSCPVDHTGDDWQLVSAHSESKASESDTGFKHKADAAKELALEADIVVTNHTLLGMQAARGIPVVFGSKKLGRFDHIIVDEGHTLPSQVRARGAAEVSERTIKQMARAVSRVIESKWIEEDAERVSMQLNRVLTRALHDLQRNEDALRVPGNDEGPLAEISDELLSLADSFSEEVAAARKMSGDLAFQQKCRLAQAACERLEQAVNDGITPEPKIARWVTKGDEKFPPRFESSPVDVSGMIFGRLWNTDPMDDEAEQEYDDDGEPIKPSHPMGVAVVSATLPAGFHMQVALGAPATEYDSPFGEAYRESAAYIPRCLSESDIAALESRYSTPAKRAFDTYRHDDWCVPHILNLVEANGGSSLVLAAKSSSGQKYVEALRRALPHLTIHSQWDGGQVSRIVEEWRNDTGSVLVGTKSLMTGVDAPGETNTLVIVDRPPRAAKNVIDEARVDLLTEQGIDRWTADRLVYVADAAMLLEQSLGRLIRHTTDRGMVAILDPRLLSVADSAFTYQAQTQALFVRPLMQFGSRLKDRSEAMSWLREKKAA